MDFKQNETTNYQYIFNKTIMINRAVSTLKTEQEELEISNENIGQISGASNYKEILGLSYNNNYMNLIPTRFKWGRNLIKVID